MADDRERLMARVVIRADGCWEWTGYRLRGYGRVGYKGRRSCPAYQAFYREFVGPIPEGLVLDHVCHDPEVCAGGSTCPHRCCVNPAHLVATTGRENRERQSRRKLLPDQRNAIRLNTAATTAELARRYGVDWTTIHHIRTGRKRWAGQ